MDKDPGQPGRRDIQSQGYQPIYEHDNSADRVRHVRVFTKSDPDLVSVLRLHDANSAMGSVKMRWSMQRVHTCLCHPGAKAPVRRSEVIQTLAVLDKGKKRRQEYLDDALWDQFEGKNQTTDCDSWVETPHRLQKLIHQAELDIIRCRTYQRSISPYLNCQNSILLDMGLSLRSLSPVGAAR